MKKSSCKSSLLKQRAFSTAKLREFWNDFSDDYVQEAETLGIPIGLDLYELTRARKAKRVIETAAGAGTASAMFIAHLLKRRSSFVACDLLDEMVSKIHQKYSDLSMISDKIKYTKLAQEGKEEIDLCNFDDFKNIYALRCSNEDIPIKDEQFDVYISNFSIHIVSDPEAMLREAHRLLKPEGTIGISLWKRRVESPFFKLFPEILRKNGGDISDDYSYFNMEGRVPSYLEKTGFKSIKKATKYIHYNENVENVLRTALKTPFYRESIRANPQEIVEHSIQEFCEVYSREYPPEEEMMHFGVEICIANK
ncbi:unnamed protein product [Moneuplotes crassus]|uniref:Methyltransferase type 11 domain-containing protein n=1 Tax=Euplotes crassus TaxID=5936 RepID=A0AAD1XPQ4_EUPCR|nr:unnamed protein product [Moneuplotes crassus]